MINAVSAMLDRAQPIHDRWTAYDARGARRAERRCHELAHRLRKAGIPEARALLQALDLQILVEEKGIAASCSLSRMLQMIDGECGEVDRHERIGFTIVTATRRWGKELRMLFGNTLSPPAKRDPGLIALLVKARKAREELLRLGEGSDKQYRNELLRSGRLAYLAPDIVEAIIAGRQPRGLSARQLVRAKSLPREWIEQRRQLGFSRDLSIATWMGCRAARSRRSAIALTTHTAILNATCLAHRD